MRASVKSLRICLTSASSSGTERAPGADVTAPPLGVGHPVRQRPLWEGQPLRRFSQRKPLVQYQLDCLRLKFMCVALWIFHCFLLVGLVYQSGVSM